MIISGGENIYAAEIEAAVLEHLEVAEAAIISAPDENLERLACHRSGAGKHGAHRRTHPPDLRGPLSILQDLQTMWVSPMPSPISPTARNIVTTAI